MTEERIPESEQPAAPVPEPEPEKKKRGRPPGGGKKTTGPTIQTFGADDGSLVRDLYDENDIAQLKAALAAMEVELARKDAELVRARASSTLDVRGDKGDYWQIELHDAPSHVVRSTDPANAWEVYRFEMGVTHSAQRPVVSPTDREAYRVAQAKRRCQPVETFQLAEGE